MQGTHLSALVAFEVGFEASATEDGCFKPTLAAAFPNTGALDLEKGALATTAGESFARSRSNPASGLGAGKRKQRKE